MPEDASPEDEAQAATAATAATAARLTLTGAPGGSTSTGDALRRHADDCDEVSLWETTTPVS